jgi:septum formation protein
MRELVPEFEVIPADIDEAAIQIGEPSELACELARLKAWKVADANPNATVLGADTVVALPLAPKEWTTLGKPADSNEAREMLTLLSGRWHMVFTGVCVVAPEPMPKFPLRERKFLGVTQVHFHKLGSEVIDSYILRSRPFDKAGSYGIQEVGDRFVARIIGSQKNVVGLPIELLQRELRLHGILQGV